MRFTRALVHGVLAATLDLVLAAFAAAMLWWNGRTSAIDASPSALLVILLMCAGLVVIRRAISLRRRRGPSDPAAVAAERVCVPVQIAFLATAAVVWRVTDSYQLGWGVAFASIALMVASSLQLLVDVTAHSVRSPEGRQRHLHLRRAASVESLHIVAALVGVAGIVITFPIHEWRAESLNGVILFVAAVILLGTAVGSVLGLLLGRPRESPEG